MIMYNEYIIDSRGEAEAKQTHSYALFETKVTWDPGTVSANSRVLRTYLQTFFFFVEIS